MVFVELKVGDCVRSKMNGNEGELGKVREVFVSGNKRKFGIDWDSGLYSIHGNRGVVYDNSGCGPYHGDDRPERRRRITAAPSRGRRSDDSSEDSSSESDRSSISNSDQSDAESVASS
jgi:hypothetical protein